MMGRQLKNTAYKISWIDSGFLSRDWQHESEIDFQQTEQVTIGFLIKENSDWIILGSSFDENNGNYSCITGIYKNNITKKEQL